MAFNKNFVVKNGLEVNADLILANAETNSVGIGTSVPDSNYALHVNGGIGATDVRITGIATVINELNVGTSGTTLTALESGLIGVGTANPSYILDVRSPVSTGQTALYVQGDVRITGDLSVDDITFDDSTVQNLTVTDTLYVGGESGLSTFAGFSRFQNYVDFESGLTISGITTITNTTDSTTYNNGALVIDGGLGVEKSVNIGGNLDVTGNISVAGSFFSLQSQEVYISNKDIILGFTTTTTPNDDTANHAGVAIASTEGYPLVSFSASGINTLPDTYKQMMWFRSGTLGFSTDIFGLNYGLAIGTTTVANGVRLAVGSDITFTDTDINAVSGSFDSLNISGISTLGTLQVSSGIVTATTGIITYYGDGSFLTGNARDLTATIGIGTSTGPVGYAVSFIEFRGPGLSTIFYDNNSGIATVNIVGGGGGSASIGIGSTPGDAFTGIITSGNLWYNSNLARLFIYYQDDDSAQWVDASPFNVGIITSLTNVSFSAGSASSPSIYFTGDQQTGLFSPTLGQVTFVSVGSSILNVNESGINVTGIITATAFVGDGSGLTGVGIGSTGSINTTGIITATAFVGDGSGLTGAGSTVFNDTTTNQEYYPLFTDITTGTITASGISTSKLTYNPSTGAVSAVDFNTTSDENLKTNIKTVENSLETVEKLRGVSFDWKETGKSSYGVIAQELEEVLPELVKDGEIKSVNYNGIIGVLIEAIKDLKQEIDQLKNK